MASSDPMTTADYPAMPSLDVDEEAARRECAQWDCGQPGQLLRCRLCPNSPTYWLRTSSGETEATR